MPYIKPEQRLPLDGAIDDLASVLLGRDDGSWNYAITRLILHRRMDSYKALQDTVGLLECVKAEFLRRQVAPYEDTKREANGDVHLA